MDRYGIGTYWFSYLSLSIRSEGYDVSKVRMGLIGAEVGGRCTRGPYAVTHQAELLGITDLDIDRAKVLANQFGAKPYPSWEDLLADDSIDAVSVVTPDFAHEEILLAAAKAGKHILAEKPLAMSVEACANGSSRQPNNQASN